MPQNCQKSGTYTLILLTALEEAEKESGLPSGVHPRRDLCSWLRKQSPHPGGTSHAPRPPGTYYKKILTVLSTFVKKMASQITQFSELDPDLDPDPIGAGVPMWKIFKIIKFGLKGVSSEN